jgi:hypothetical protein|tara:strand:+ start:455 stop:631 length:177 start_codon:yes stop_codon:yes gene_type:complete
MEYIIVSKDYEEKKRYHSQIEKEIFGEQSPMILAETNPKEFERLTQLVGLKMKEKFGE